MLDEPGSMFNLQTMRQKQMSENNFAPHKSFDYTSWYSDWESFARSSTKKDGPESVDISNYLFNVAKIDRRNIATGGAADYEFVIHYPRPNLANSYGEAQWMPILLIQAIMDIAPKNKILGLSGGLDRFRLKPFQDIYGSKIFFLNNKKLALYEKFQFKNTPMEYEIIQTQQILSRKDRFDMSLGWSQDMENPFLPAGKFVDCLNDGGVMVIQNSSDSVFLYQNDTIASPVWSYHEELKSRKDCRVYHIPLFYGITVVVKRENNVCF